MDKILIVDDTSKNIQAVATILHKAGFNIAYATSAEVALSKIKQINFDLILLDTLMPDIDGFELCDKLKADETSRNIPILFMIKRSNEHNVEKAYLHGAQDYVAKPYNARELVVRIKNQIRLKEIDNTKIPQSQDRSSDELFDKIENSLNSIQKFSQKDRESNVEKSIEQIRSHLKQLRMQVV